MSLSNLLIRTTTKPGVVPAATAALGFGKFFSDHMLTRSWSKSGGWAAPQIEPFGNLSLPPQSSVLHYGACVFEGMKAYKDAQGRVRLFRPDKNMDRLKKSAHRLALPDDCPDMLESIKRLVLLDQRFIPSVDGYSLYIRPTIIGTHQNLGVAVSESALFFTITGPVGPYYPEGFKPISLFADTTHARACEGGVGNAKCGGNYAPTILPAQEAAKLGFQQVLWLSGPRHVVTEVGTSNFFVLWKNSKGEEELITAPLDDGTILHGVTRDSVLALARARGAFKVSEKEFTMAELVAALKEKRVKEVFGAGTAAVISPVKAIHYQGTTYDVPVDPQQGIGKVSKSFLDQLLDIQYGRVPHEWSVVIS